MNALDHYEIANKTIAKFIHENLQHCKCRASWERIYARTIALAEMIVDGIVTDISEGGRARLIALYYAVRDDEKWAE